MRRLGADHEVIRIDPAHAETAVFCEVYGYPLDRSANTILVAAKRGAQRYGACVLLATTRLDVNKVVRRELGFSKASFADPDETRARTGMEIGGVTALALPSDLPLLVDARVLEADWVILGGGGRSTKIKVSPAALLDLPGARVVENLAIPVSQRPA